MLGSPDPAAELIKVRQAEAIGAIDDDGVGIRNIEAALDDRGADQDVYLSGNKPAHDGFQFVRVHLAVAEFHPGARAKIRDFLAHFLDRLDAVVEEINLALPIELAVDG